MQYYINKAEPFSKGKKLELDEEGKQFPIKNVTIWNDHPRFNEFVPGATLDFEIYEKPSANINPKTGQPYMDRSVSKYTSQKAQNCDLSDLDAKLDKILVFLHKAHGVPQELEEEIKEDDDLAF